MEVEYSTVMYIYWASWLTGIPDDFLSQTAAITIELCIFVLLMAPMVWAFKRQHQRMIAEAKKSKQLPTEWKRDQPWRHPTDIRFIEDLKADLLHREWVIELTHRNCVAVIKKSEHLSATGGLSGWCLRFWFALSSRQWPVSDSYHTQALNLALKLDRIWGGNVHLEIEDCREHIRKLNRRRQDIPENDEKKDKVRSIDESVIAWERKLDDLQEVVKRSQTNPHQAAYNTTQTIVGLDILHEIQIALAKPALTRMEAAKVREDMARRYRENPHLTEEEKTAAIKELSNTFDRLFPKAPATVNTVDIYKKEA